MDFSLELRKMPLLLCVSLCSLGLFRFVHLQGGELLSVEAIVVQSRPCHGGEGLG